ncbi:hypothetical protein QUG14_01425 [Neobacillus sp. CF12]|nr:hypothetical protein [Neobacillus sp. CF12]MDM5326325.1 hypothetical protein [Neobacillus sp. CF12]
MDFILPLLNKYNTKVTFFLYWK